MDAEFKPIEKLPVFPLDVEDQLAISQAQRVLNRAKVEMAKAEAEFNEMLCNLEDKYDICTQVDKINLQQGVIERASYSETKPVATARE